MTVTLSQILAEIMEHDPKYQEYWDTGCDEE